MEILSAEELNEVNGGLIPLVAVLIFTWSNAGRIQAVITGFLDSMAAH